MVAAASVIIVWISGSSVSKALRLSSGTVQVMKTTCRTRAPSRSTMLGIEQPASE
jgi:hypothetical protein